jgi:hypothetical protein
MTEIGDQLRKLAEEADSWPNLSSYACVVTANTALRSFTEFFAKDDDMAREQAVSMLGGLTFKTPGEQERGAALWCQP